jgi:hypothetical protein
VAGGAVWLTSGASGGETTGRLLKVNTATGALLGTWSVGGDPVAVAVAGARVWVADGAGPRFAEPNRVIEMDTSGHRLHTYAVTNPGGLVADGTQAWVAGFDNNIAQISRLHDGVIEPVTVLPGVPTADVPLVRCADDMYSITGTTGDSSQLIVTQITADSMAHNFATIDGQTVYGLTCQAPGVIVSADSQIKLHSSVARLTSAGTSPTVRDLAAPRGRAIAGSSGAWLVAGGSTDSHDMGSRLDPNTLQTGPASDLQGAVVAATADGDVLWVVLTTQTGTVVQSVR